MATDQRTGSIGLTLSDAEQIELRAIQDKARRRHERRYREARRKGRFNFPPFPYECSWAYVEEFRRRKRFPLLAAR